MSLAYFHATVKSRLSYGIYGWNKNYDFNDYDFKMSMILIYDFLNK